MYFLLIRPIVTVTITFFYRGDSTVKYILIIKYKAKEINVQIILGVFI